MVPRYGAEVVGGAEALARSLARRLVVAGWEVEVLTTCAVDAATWRNARAPGVEVEDGVVVRRFRVGVPRWPWGFHQASRALFRLPARVRPERVWVAAQGPWSPGLLRAVAAGGEAPALFLPYLYHPTLRGLPECPGPRILLPAAHDERPLRLRAVARAVAAADALLYSTEEERALLERVHPVARARPAEVGTVGVEAPAGVDGGRFRQRFGVRGPYLLYGGRRATGKGLEELLEGVAQLRGKRPEVVLVLTGEAGVGVGGTPGVLAVGRLDEATRWDALAGAEAVVVPSWQESLSLLALEAWALGRPVLVNGASPVLAGQVARSGGGVVYRGAAGLATEAAALLDDAGRTAALGAAGREHVRRTYRWENVVERMEQLVEASRGAARRFTADDWS